MNTWIDHYATWEGTAAELAELVNTLANDLGLPDDAVAPNERLVRHYVQAGLLRKPERHGKEALFGQRQLLEFLAAKTLKLDGWPLAKIAEMTSRSSTSEILELLPAHAKMNKARSLIQKFKRSTDQGSVSQNMVMYSRTMASTRRKLSLQESLQAFGSNNTKPPRNPVVCLEMAPWCRVYVDVDELKRLPPEIPELLGHALAEVLQDERDRKGDKR